jgi:rRNA maturation RNase YbeY
VDFVFTDDESIKDINNEFLKHNYYTDVITFDYSTGSILAGEIYVSIDRVKENAENYGVSFTDELKRVMAHGILHLIGYKDSTGDEKTKMREREDYWINKWQDGPYI